MKQKKDNTKLIGIAAIGLGLWFLLKPKTAATTTAVVFPTTGGGGSIAPIAPISSFPSFTTPIIDLIKPELPQPPAYVAPVVSAPAPVYAAPVVSAPAPVYAAPVPVVAYPVETAPAAPVYEKVIKAPVEPTPIVSAPAPIYASPVTVEPTPVASTPVVSAPAPIYSAPLPIYIAPVPVYIPPFVSIPVVAYPVESVAPAPVLQEAIPPLEKIFIGNPPQLPARIEPLPVSAIVDWYNSINNPSYGDSSSSSSGGSMTTTTTPFAGSSSYGSGTLSALLNLTFLPPSSNLKTSIQVIPLSEGFQ